MHTRLKSPSWDGRLHRNKESHDDRERSPKTPPREHVHPLDRNITLQFQGVEREQYTIDWNRSSDYHDSYGEYDGNR